MKRTFMILLCIVFSSVLNAQQWEIDFGDASTYTWLNQGITDREQNTIFYGRSGYDKTDYYPYIIRVDQEGNHQSYVLGDEQFHNLDYISMVQMENGEFFMVGDKDYNSIYAIVLDTGFNVLSCKRYDKPEDAHSIVGGHLLLDQDGTVVLVGVCNHLHGELGVFGSYYYCRFDNNADTIASRFYTPETQPGIHAYEYELDQLLLNPHADGYVLLGSGIHGKSMMHYDRDFNYVGGVQLYANREVFSNAYSDLWLPNDRLLIMGRVISLNDDLQSIGLSRVGLDGTIEPFNRFYCKQDTILQTLNQSMAYANDTTIYGAIGHLLSLTGPCITRICLFNTEMELLGLKEISTEETNHYCPGSIFPTPDGGCIFSVMEYHTFGENHYHGKIIKLSREDLNPIPCSVKEVPNTTTRASAFPNPATTELNINIPNLPDGKQHRIQISDAMGRICMNRIIRDEGNLLSVGISHFSPGAYTYYIYNNESIVITGKFIKN